MPRRRPITALDDHPNVAEISGMIARLPHIPDTDLPHLAGAWTNSVVVADARARALEPDSPLVFEVLAAFDAVQAMWADDLAGRGAVDAAVVSAAMKAVRDALAGAYARPVIGRSAHHALVRPWRRCYPSDSHGEPDLGRRGDEVRSLLRALPWLATRCHDDDAAALWDALDVQVWIGDRDLRSAARTEALTAARLTGRQRTWGLLRRSAAEGVSRPCPPCRQRPTGRDVAPVLTLCLDAACGLLVADAISDELLGVLTQPVRSLIPSPRPASY
jgi:hypothetical protein